MSKIVSLACLLLAVGLSLATLVIVHNASAVLDQSQALYAGVSRPQTAAARADDLAAAAAGDAVRQVQEQEAERREAQSATPDLSPLASRSGRETEEPEADAREPTPALTPQPYGGGAAANPYAPPQRQDTSSTTLGYTLPQTGYQSSPSSNPASPGTPR